MIYSSSTRVRLLTLWLMICSGLALSGCTFTVVLNSTSQPVRVAIMAPNGKGLRVKTIAPDGLKVVATQIGGAYLVRVLADRSYINQLLAIKTRLLAYANTPDLPLSEYEKVLADIESLRKQIKEAEDNASKDSPTCVGSLIDYSTLDATIYYNDATQKFRLECNVATYENFTLSPPE